MDRETLELILANLHDERQAVYLYARLEETESGKAGTLFGKLRIESEKQAAIWEQELRRKGGTVPPWRPGARTRLVAWLLSRLGPRRMLPVLSAMKVRGLVIYRAGGFADDAAPAGGAAAAGAATTGTAATPRPSDGGAVAEESWHRATRGGGALRAAVFGINDGLVSNASLIVGLAGANPDPRFILLAGVAGLLGGGLSMAAGEYVSVRTQREFLEHQIALERSEMALMPEEEIAELTLIYRTKGLEPAEAEALARRIVTDPEWGLETLAREELGLDPRALASPATAAVASFLSFVGGAFIPLAPYLATRGETAFFGTLAVTLVSLLAIGALMALFTGRRPLSSALRMALLGCSAAGATYAIGALLGVVVG